MVKTPTFGQLATIAALLAVGYFLVAAFVPTPVAVSLGRAEWGPMQVTVDEEGETRIHDRYTVSATVAGRLRRVELHEGDPVTEGQVVAELEPVPLSVREVEEQRARVTAAEAALQEAESLARHVQSDYEQAKRDQRRQEQLFKAKLSSAQLLERARVATSMLANEVEAARFKALSAAAQVRLAGAALATIAGTNDGTIRPLALRSAIVGRVLRIHEKSERLLTAGTPIMTLGDPRRLEIVIDILSTDAVNVTPGMPVLLERWGGDRTLQARVRVVEPHAFTKVSALGIEEQRVNVVADFTGEEGGRASRLGDGYRVEARIVTWQAEKVLRLASGALFREGDDWAVFVYADGYARKRTVGVGHRNANDVEILRGLQAGDMVIAYPSNDVHDGVRVMARAE